MGTSLCLSPPRRESSALRVRSASHDQPLCASLQRSNTSVCVCVDEGGRKTSAGDDSESGREKKPRGVRQGYVHKPFLYSRYYSDSDDEVTVEQRRRSVVRTHP